MLHSFTRNHNDLSTEAGFQFEFFCDCCGNGFKSTFQESTTYEKKKKTERFGGFSAMLGGLMNNRVGDLGYSLERGSSILGDRLNEQSPAWRKEHEAAFDQAQEEVRPMFRKCPAINGFALIAGMMSRVYVPNVHLEKQATLLRQELVLCREI